LKTLCPFSQVPFGHSRLSLHGREAAALGQQKDRLCSPYRAGGHRCVPRPGTQLFELFVGGLNDRRGFAASHGNLLVHQVRAL
jgi:hypothetical protein